MRRRPGLPRFHSRLLMLAGVSLVPLVALSIVLAGVMVQRQQASLRDAVITRTRSLTSAVDAQMAGHLGMLRVLATSEALERGDLLAFQELARRAAARQPEWRNVLVVDAQGHQRVNLRFAPGQALPDELPEERSQLQDLLRQGTDASRIRSLGRGPSGYVGVPVRLVVQVAGEPMVLELIVRPDAFGALMRQQHLPASWVLGIIDANGRFIARVPDRPLGDMASPYLRAAMASGPEGWYRGRTLEGRDTFSAYVRSDVTGWTVACAIPSAEVLGPARTAAWIVAAGGAFSIAVALAAAAWLARRIGRPIARLAGHARLIAEGRPPADGPGAAAAEEDSFEEMRPLAQALERAAAAVAERETLMKREQGALVAADKAKDEFLAMLGHELRNPLSAITASAHVLRLASPGSPPATMARQVIERQARQMTRLVEDLLDVSRLAMHKLTLEPEPLDLGTLAERCAQTWAQAVEGREARLALHAQPAWVMGDRARLEQVLANLLDNAEKFSHGIGGIEVSVRAEGGEAVLEVADHGEGIAPEHRARIFEPFVQGPQTLDRPKGGLGLGLALVQRLATLHGGRVEVRSEGAGQGACFTVRLPRCEAPVAAGRPDAEAPARDAGLRLLLVEDNEDGRRVMEALLSMEGHAVRSAPDGATALAMAREEPPDVVLIDIGLPDMDGHEVARRLRAMGGPRRPRLVALSGYGQPDDQRRAYEAGFDLHLTKPVDPGCLRAALRAPGG